MPIDAALVDKWSAKYDSTNRAEPFRLDGKRLDTELSNRFPAAHAIVRQFNTLYDFEDHLFTTVHGNLVGRGAYSPEEFLIVDNWKSRRPIGFYVQNRTARIQQLSRTAFANASQPWDQLQGPLPSGSTMEALSGSSKPGSLTYPGHVPRRPRSAGDRRHRIPRSSGSPWRQRT